LLFRIEALLDEYSKNSSEEIAAQLEFLNDDISCLQIMLDDHNLYQLCNDVAGRMQEYEEERNPDESEDIESEVYKQKSEIYQA
jgi:hypothetical protein